MQLYLKISKLANKTTLNTAIHINALKSGHPYNTWMPTWLKLCYQYLDLEINEEMKKCFQVKLLEKGIKIFFLSSQQGLSPCPSRYCSTSIWKVMGLTSIEGLKNSFSKLFDLRTLLYLFTISHVAIPVINITTYLDSSGC